MFTMEKIQMEPRTVLYIRTKTNVEALQNLIGSAYMELLNHIQQENQTPLGLPYTAYYGLDEENHLNPADMVVECGFPVKKPVKETEVIKLREIEACTALSCTYEGYSKGLNTVYKRMAKWIQENGYKSCGMAYEFYMSAPEVPPEKQVTRVIIPLEK